VKCECPLLAYSVEKLVVEVAVVVTVFRGCVLSSGFAGFFVRKRIKVFIRKSGQNLAIAATLMAFCAGALAETIVYKWVDEDGVVHFGDAPPDESTSAETLVIPKAPPAPVQQSTNSSAASITGVENEPLPEEAEAPPLYEKTDVAHLSIADLNLRCDEAREKMIAPLREAEIAQRFDSWRLSTAELEQVGLWE